MSTLPIQDPRLRLAMMGIPSPQSVQQAPMVQPISSVQPTLPYQQSGVGGVVESITNFVNNYKRSQDNIKQQAMGDADRDLKLLQMGVPINQEKLAKNLKRAGIELDYNSPPPMVNDPSRPTQQINVPTSSPVPGQGQMMSAISQPQMPGPRPQPGMMDRFKQAIGAGNPNVAPNSAAMQWINAQAQQGKMAQELQQRKQQLEFLTTDNAINTGVIMKGVLNGDAKAMKMAKQTGLLQMTPMDQVMMAGEAAGLDPNKVGARYMRALLGDDKLLSDQTKMATDLAPRFGGDVKKAFEYVQSLYDGTIPSESPGRTVEENVKIVQQANELRQRYPTLPENIALTMSLAQITGNHDAIGAIAPLLARMPSKDMLDMAQTQWNILDKKDQMRHRGVQEQLGWAANKVANANLSLRAQANHLQLLGLMNQASGRAVDNYLGIAANKESTPEQKKEALAAAASAINAMPPIPFGTDAKGNPQVFHPGKVSVQQVEKWFQFMRDEEYYLGLMSEDVDNSKKPNKAGDPLAEFLRLITPRGDTMPMIPTMVPGQ